MYDRSSGSETRESLNRIPKRPLGFLLPFTLTYTVQQLALTVPKDLARSIPATENIILGRKTNCNASRKANLAAGVFLLFLPFSSHSLRFVDPAASEEEVSRTRRNNGNRKNEEFSRAVFFSFHPRASAE